ncbi:MAG TPA: hypothetical protein PLA50_18430, partial [Bacteroidia bacterium]|nr:hypothetical protein [Bacteroidia bacterium]
KGRRSMEKFILSALVGKVWTSQFSSGSSEDLYFLEGGKGYRVSGGEKNGDFTYKIDGDQVLTFRAGYSRKITLKNSVEGECVYIRSANDHLSCPFVFSRTISPSDEGGSQ